MRIQKLDKDSKANLLEDLLRRSPNNYTEYETRVAAILQEVKEKKMRRYLLIQNSLIKQILIEILSV